MAPCQGAKYHKVVFFQRSSSLGLSHPCPHCAHGAAPAPPFPPSLSHQTREGSGKRLQSLRRGCRHLG